MGKTTDLDTHSGVGYNEFVRPCPHCGSTDLWGPNLAEYCGDTYDPRWWIECNDCPCGMEVFSENREDLINAWNKRVNRLSVSMLYRHIKTGKIYRLLADSVDCTNSRDGTAVAIYCPDDDEHTIYVRDREEFDAKFEPWISGD